MNFFRIIPAVYGYLGPGTEPFSLAPGQKRTKIVYQFDDVPLDCLTMAMDCYICTETAVKRLKELKVTGVEFDDVVISKTDSYEDHSKGRTNFRLPSFRWLKIAGLACQSDIGLALDLPIYKLIVSERVLEVLKDEGLSQAEIDLYPGCGPTDSEIALKRMFG